MSTQYLDNDENMADLVGQMPADEQQRYLNYGHRRIESVFVDRMFIIYKPTGLNAAKQHREPEILTTVRVVDFMVDSVNGATAKVTDDKHAREMRVTAVPKKLFDYPIYISIPPRLELKWDARLVGERVRRSMSFAFLIKTKNKSDFYSQGNTYAESPNVFKRLYPNVTGDWTF